MIIRLIKPLCFMSVFLPLLAYSLEITQVTENTRWIKEIEHRSLIIDYSISEPAITELCIYDARDYLINAITSQTHLPAGRHQLAWDLNDIQGHSVPFGEYHYTIKAMPEDNSKAPVVYDLTELTGNKRIVPRQVEWSSDDKQIRYVLTDHALVNIRVGLKDGGPLMNTVVDWLPRAGGVNEESWDGMDNSGFINLSGHPQRDISILAYSFPDNSILIGDEFSHHDYIDIAKETVQKRPSLSQVTKRFVKNAPTRQSPHQRGDIQIKLILAEDYETNANKQPVVHGKVPFRLDVDEQYSARAANVRFEAAFFVDGLKVFENEIGFLPMTWYWDTTHVNPGNHYITANLIGYDGSFGMQTMSVEVSP